MLMKYLILINFIFLSFRISAQDSQANWKTAVVVDGSANEWKVPLRFYSTYAALFFSVANDSTNLYLCIQANDEKTQMKIARAGMKIKFAAKGNLKCDASVDFPIGTKQEPTPSTEVEVPKHSSIKEKRTTMLAQNVSLSAKGFATQNGILPIKNNEGIQTAIDWNEEDKMTYELSVPLKELFGLGFTLKEMTKALTITIEINALTRPLQRNHSEDAAGAGDVSGGGMGGGGMGGGNMDSRGGMGGGGHHKNQDGESGRNEEETGVKLFDPTSFKQRFILAQKESD